MYEYQKKNTFFAQAPGMMEELCAEELVELGATNTRPVYRGVVFEAMPAALYRINYMSRMLSRVLAPLDTFPCKTPAMLMRKTMAIRWEEFFDLDQTFAITSSGTNEGFTNSLYAAQCMKDGIADYFRGIRQGKRPSVDTTNPDVRLNLRIEKDTAVISLDTSGESLHKRGYRLLAGEAPMQETLAAAIVRLTGWDGEQPFWDCMCGSGTLLSEALMSYCRMPAQILRENFGFTRLPDFHERTWQVVKEECDAAIRPLPVGLIAGSDISREALVIARKNLLRLPYGEDVELFNVPFQKVERFENGVLVANPPYGIRIGEAEEVRLLYGELGDFLKQRCNGTSAYIYTGDPSLRKAIGLRTSRRIPLVNGKLEGVLLKFESYEGTKKTRITN